MSSLFSRLSAMILVLGFAGVTALKGFLISLILIVVIDAVTKMSTTRNAGVMIAFAIGAIYIILALRNWEKNKEYIRGATIGWIVAANE
jgi:hypothetical protein